MRYSHDLPQAKINAESARRITLDCTDRCTYSRYDYEGKANAKGSDSENNKSSKEGTIAMAMNFAEDVCMSRCLNKQLQAKEVIDRKLKGQI